MMVDVGSNPSLDWRSIWSARHVIIDECRWRIGDRISINIQRDAWIINENNFKLVSSIKLGMKELLVQDLWIRGCCELDIELIQELFKEEDMTSILKLLRGLDNQVDMFIWHYDTHGKYTVKSGYRLAVKRSFFE